MLGFVFAFCFLLRIIIKPNRRRIIKDKKWAWWKSITKVTIFSQALTPGSLKARTYLHQRGVHAYMSLYLSLLLEYTRIAAVAPGIITRPPRCCFFRQKPQRPSTEPPRPFRKVPEKYRVQKMSWGGGIIRKSGDGSIMLGKLNLR